MKQKNNSKKYLADGTGRRNVIENYHEAHEKNFTQNLVLFSIYYITVHGTNKFNVTLITFRNYFCLFNKM